MIEQYVSKNCALDDRLAQYIDAVVRKLLKKHNGDGEMKEIFKEASWQR